MVASGSGPRHTDLSLSVLALSSRFDGLYGLYPRAWLDEHFQYSLCRVVLMVYLCRHPLDGLLVFQYSLCRVVLMVSEGMMP